MTEVKRYYVGKNGLVEGKAIGRLSVVLGADFDRVEAECNALQQRLNTADQRNDELVELLRQIGELRGTLDQHGLLEQVDAAIKSANGACQFPQSCTTRCAER